MNEGERLQPGDNKKLCLRVIDLFAGVGGFRLGLEGGPGMPDRLHHKYYKVVWSNQWEPSKKLQHASDIYIKKFGQKGHSNEDIEKVIQNHFQKIPNHDLLVGGFPCQDYSVARTLNQAVGITGKKGILWWSIYNILDRKKFKPRYLFLENVDRLLKSPANQRGRDFAIMLSSLANLGYCVEWRMINAADYGYPQKRRRVYFLCYYKKSDLYKKMKRLDNKWQWISNEGVFSRAFPVAMKTEPLLKKPVLTLDADLVNITNSFNKRNPSKTIFSNAGVMIDHEVWTADYKPEFKGNPAFLENILIDEEKVPDEFFIDEKELDKWKSLKDAKSIKRISKRTGAEYTYDEGSMVFPDRLDWPSRTIVTGEGGRSPSRFKHVIKRPKGRYRRLTPIELERLNGFPDGHTKGVPDSVRAFLMGNALVVGIIDRVGEMLISAIEED